MKEITLKVSGMMCCGCENRVEKALSLVSGVKSVAADHKSGMVSVSGDDNIDETVISEKIDNLGFTVTGK